MPDETQPNPNQKHDPSADQDGLEPEAEAFEFTDGDDAVTKLQRERDDLQSRLQRVWADYQNYLKRVDANIATAREQQLIDVGKTLVVVMDHFDTAVNIDPQRVGTESLLKGVQIVRDELLKALAKFGIERLDVQPGEPFNPARHEALLRQPLEGVESNHVAQQMQPGYVLGDKTIRPAKVSVTP